MQNALFDLDVDFDRYNSDQMDELTEHAKVLARKVSDHQLDTQNRVIYVNANEGIKLSPVIRNVREIMGKKCSIDGKHSIIKIYGEISSSYVFSNLKFVRPIIIELHNKISHLTISGCKNVILKLTNTSFAGIECINSRKVSISVKTLNFVRVTTGSDISLYGISDSSTILDIRNSSNVTVNNELLPGCVFTEARFKYHANHYEYIKEEHDIFSSGNLSVPNVTLLKYYK